MTSKYDPYENAKAETVNGTIKNDFELDKILPDIKYAHREITKDIKNLQLPETTPKLPHANTQSNASTY